MSQRTIGKRSKNMKKWICDFFEDLWRDFKDDPFGFIFMIGCFAVLIYAVCTGQIQDTGGGHAPHGINLIPTYNGDNVTFLPMPY